MGEDEILEGSEDGLDGLVEDPEIAGDEDSFEDEQDALDDEPDSIAESAVCQMPRCPKPAKPGSVYCMLCNAQSQKQKNTYGPIANRK